jgi:putative acetyltransferase
MAIRTPGIADEDQIRQVYLAAFGDDEKELIATLAGELLREDAASEILHLVAEDAGQIIGHIAFSPVLSRPGEKGIGYILAPLAVDPGNQEKGIGSHLVREGLRLLATRDIEIVFVYGDPDYYGRFGFATDLAESYTPPFKLKYPFGWQAIALSERRPSAHSQEIKCVGALNKPEIW